MPIIKSAKKRVRSTQKASIQNAKTRRILRDSIKAFHEALTNRKDTANAQSRVFSALDTAVKKHVITKNKAARKKKQLNEVSRIARTTKTGSKKLPSKAKKTTLKTKTAKRKKATTAKETTSKVRKTIAKK